MASFALPTKGHGPRKSILDLAPLELDCMNTLWPLGEGTVRQIQQRLAESRPRAYTTIMTIMDRLAHKGVVTRHKVGRAYLYQPNLSAEEARARAVEQVLEGFFDGSAEALAEHLDLAGGHPAMRRATPGNGKRAASTPPETPSRPPASPAAERAAEEPAIFPTTRLDETLL